MRPLSRRRALQLGGLGVAGIVVGGGGLAWAGNTRDDPGQGETFTAPEVLTSTAGNLTLTLEAAMGSGSVAGRDATTLRYNGGLPGPTLRLRPGDHLGIDLVNNLAQPTNLHTHGLQVSPAGKQRQPVRDDRPRRERSATTTRSRTITPLGRSGITRTTTAWSPTRSSPVSTGPSSSTNQTHPRSARTGCW